jgi:hypothetical protein
MACFAMLPVIVTGSWLLGVLADERISELIALLSTGVLSLAMYAVALRVLGRVRGRGHVHTPPE